MQLDGLTNEESQILTDLMHQVSFGKKELIIQEGARDDYTYFVEHGSVRSYVLRGGNPVTLGFSFEGDLVGSFLGTTGRQTARATVETLEPSVLVKISRQKLERLFESSVKLANWARKLAEKRLSEYDDYFTEYFWTDKETQYLKIMQEYPELLQRISLKELASFLNVTPQTLSRIRARVR